MEIRPEYRPKIERELTNHEKALWSFTPRKTVPDVLAIKEPPTEPPLYPPSVIDEEKECFYKTSSANYFTNKFQKQIEKEQTWGMYLTDGGAGYIRPLERSSYYDAREMIKKFFLPKDPLWSWYGFEQDEEAYSDLMRIMKDWLTANQSICAINPKKKVLNGVAVGVYNDGTYLAKKISQVQVFNPLVTKIMNIRRFFEKKVTASLKYWDKTYYEINLLCTEESFPVKQVPSLLRGLLNGCLGMAKHLNVDWVFGISTQAVHDTAYEESGFEKTSSCPLYSLPAEEGHLAGYRSFEESAKITVWVKEMSPNTDMKWKYYRRMHDDFSNTAE